MLTSLTLSMDRHIVDSISLPYCCCNRTQSHQSMRKHIRSIDFRAKSGEKEKISIWISRQIFDQCRHIENNEVSNRNNFEALKSAHSAKSILEMTLLDGRTTQMQTFDRRHITNIMQFCLHFNAADFEFHAGQRNYQTTEDSQ